MLRVALIDLAHPHRHIKDALKDLAELQSLVKTYGAIDVAQIIQHRSRPDKNTFIGSGKVQELKQIVEIKKIDVIILNAIVNHSQIFHLTQALWPINPKIEVWDRIDLILNIFDKHAQSAQAKLQIEIAKMQHIGPRIYGLGGSYFSRQAGGIGTRGIGEKNIELMKRHWRSLIHRKKLELKKLEEARIRQLNRRKEIGLKSVSIIGYTNAGKTSLFNLFTGKDKEVKDALFITLDSVSGNLNLPNIKKTILISDTIGFIQNLPTHLIQTFKSTLMESINADLLLQVIDIDDEKMNTKIETVQKVLSDLGISSKKRIFVFNKMDKLDGQKNFLLDSIKQKYAPYSPVFISVEKEEGIQQLKNQVIKFLSS